MAYNKINDAWVLIFWFCEWQVNKLISDDEILVHIYNYVCTWAHIHHKPPGQAINQMYKRRSSPCEQVKSIFLSNLEEVSMYYLFKQREHFRINIIIKSCLDCKSDCDKFNPVPSRLLLQLMSYCDWLVGYQSHSRYMITCICHYLSCVLSSTSMWFYIFAILCQYCIFIE